MWSSIVGKKENKEKPLLKSRLNRRFDEPFNVEFVSDMISFVKLPVDLVGIIEEYLQPIFNISRYKLCKDRFAFYHTYLYEGYNFYRRFNIMNSYKKNYSFKIRFTTTKDSAMYCIYRHKLLYSVSVELFDRNSKVFYFKNSLMFPKEHLKYLCSLSYKVPDDIVLFQRYLIKLGKDSEYQLNTYIIEKSLYKESLVIWSKVFKDVCLCYGV